MDRRYWGYYIGRYGILERPKLILNYMNENESLEKHELNDDAIQSFRNWEAPEFDEAVQSFRNAVQNVNKLLEIDVKYRDLKDAFKILKQDFGTSSTTADKVSFLIGTAPSVSENDKIKIRKNIKFAFEFHDTKQPLQILIASLEQYTFNCINGEDFSLLKNIFTMDIDNHTIEQLQGYYRKMTDVVGKHPENKDVLNFLNL